MSHTLDALRPAEPPSARSAATAAGVGVIVLACGAAAAAGGLAGPWYPALLDPDRAAAGWVRVGWAAAYAGLAAAGTLAWLARDRGDVCGPLGLLGVVLAADLGWAVFFLGCRSPLLGLLGLVVAAAAAAAAVGSFARVSRAAGGLVVPYLGWVAYAAAVNADVLLLSRCPVG